MVSASDSQSVDPGFESRSVDLLDLLSVVPSSNPRPRLPPPSPQQVLLLQDRVILKQACVVGRWIRQQRQRFDEGKEKHQAETLVLVMTTLRRIQLVLINPLSPKSDQHQFSPCNIFAP